MPARPSRSARNPRNPLDPTGLLAWLRRGPQGRFLRAGRERLFAGSHRMFVRSAYRALLDRDPDHDGLAHFVGDLSHGRTTREEVLRHLGGSGEAAGRVLLGPGIREHVAEFVSLRASVPPSAPPVCFLHPMKTGGTALTLGLSTMADPWPRLLDVWVDQLVCLPRPLLARAMLVTGHLPYSALALLPDDVAVVTVVREPVARTLSHFAHVRTHGRQMQLTLEEFVTAEHWRAVWVDYQARQLAIDIPITAAWRGEAAGTGTLQQLVDAPPPPELGADQLAQRALERAQGIHVVGVSDDLDAVLRRVADLWAKPSPPPLPRSNESLAAVRPADVSAKLRAAIVEGTRADAALYDYARERAAAST